MPISTDSVRRRSLPRITNDVNQVQLAVALGIRQLIRWPLLAAGSMVAALAIDIRLGLIFLVSTPVIGGAFWFVMAKCVPFYRGMQVKLDRLALITREGLSGARVVRAFTREDHERERFREAAADQAATAIAVGRLSSVLNPVTFLVMYGAVALILWMGGIEVQVGDLTQGEVTAFVNYMTQTLLSIVYVANLVVVFTKASASAARVHEVLDCAPSVTDAGNKPVELPVLGQDGAMQVPALRMRDVSFSYPGASASALCGIDLTLMPGQTLGVIGGTGSGKSTFVSLIPRLYDTASGAVEVLGHDVRSWPLKQLRHVVGMVPQTASLISGTIRSNLTWRDAHATDEELWRSLEVAQAADFVRALPEGLDSPVEAGGKNFSGGSAPASDHRPCDCRRSAPPHLGRLRLGARFQDGCGAPASACGSTCPRRGRGQATACDGGGLAARRECARRRPHHGHAPRSHGGARHTR